MSDKTWAHGTQLKLDGGSEIAAVGSITGPGLTRETIDVTSHDSTDGYREFIGSLRDGGEVGFGIIYDPAEATHGTPSTGLMAQFESNSLGSWDLVFPDSKGTWSFNGFLTSFEPTEAIDDAMRADITVKVSGKPVFDLPAAA